MPYARAAHVLSTPRRASREALRTPSFLGASLLALLALGGSLVAGCGARSSLIDDEHESGPPPVPRVEACNGIDDDLDGLRASGAEIGDAELPDAARRRRDAGPGRDGGARDGGARDGGARDAGARDGGTSMDGAVDMDAGDMDAGGGDLDLWVDEDFRDEQGRYVDDEHCGVCGNSCLELREHELDAMCGLIDESPTCVALRCEPGWVPGFSGRCVPAYDRLCLACADDGDCGEFEGAGCADVLGERRCAIDCELGCPDGYACSEGLCLPEGGSCSCDPGDRFDLACSLTDPEGLHCPGSARCDDGVIGVCEAPIEVCDEVDQDCDGLIDEGYRDARGAYILDIHHCGECGVDCTLSSVPEGDLVCGGDPFAPSCVLHCPDADDGLQPGDRVDGDRIIATGCECTVTSTSDQPGPVRTSGPMLDVNCDGADGIVIESFYVAPDGDDANPGSPTRPLRTLAAAARRAAESLETAAPRRHVFVASGTYTETLELPDGVLLHGGYRRDFLSLDPDGFRVEIRAPLDTTAPGGAAVVTREAGQRETVLEWVALRGLDATSDGQAAFGMVVIDPGAMLSIRDMQVRSGVAGTGRNGGAGGPGRSLESMPEEGEPPRGAVEDAAHRCTAGGPNRVMGGDGGRNTCGGVDTSGGAGGSAGCPMMSAFQPAGAMGRAAGGGQGGMGGQDSRGPITRETGTCPTDVCCGLADFSVPTDFSGPQPGRPGRDGGNGTPGRACAEPFGTFDGDTWVGSDGSSGSSGSPGSGGGGGGAGGGAEMDWFDRVCEFPDGLGGGGGGGGAGGCGGEPGTGGTSGAPAVAILVRYSMGVVTGVPIIRGVRVSPAQGGRGGDGGAGGEGGRGANGAFGGSLDRADRVTPTLSGPFAGGRGGAGGNGGSGGGGGGGCGGASVGIWIVGLGTREPMGVGAWRSGNTFVIATPGVAGRGGGGPAAGADGAAGGAIDVLVR